MALKVIIKVTPSAGKQLCQLDKNGTLKCYLKSPPEHGKANAELIELLAKKLGIGRDDLALLLGATSRTKTLLIKAPLSLEEFLAKVCQQRQLKIG